MNHLQQSSAYKSGANGKARLIHEDLLKRIPPDILREMALRRFEEIQAAGYDIPDAVSTLLVDRKKPASA
jgi:hypothetical protein